MIATQASSPPASFSFQSTSTSSTTTTTSPPRTPRRPSMSKPMSWLGRTNASGHAHSHSNASSSGSSTIHISEPKLVNDMFTSTGGTTYTHARYGVLGMGATVVRTPQDALARAMIIQAQQPYPSQDPPGTEEDDDRSSYEEEPEPVSPGSPPLPPLPYASKSSPNLPSLSELGELVDARDTSSPMRSRPTRPPPAVPQARPILKTSPTSPSALPVVPTLPLNVTPTPPQPPFTPILLSPVPDTLFDLSSLLVTLETSTSSLRTTYATLTSRPSHLADYLKSLSHSAREREQRKFRDTLVEEEEEYEDDENDDGQKLSSPNTPFSSLFAAHLTSAGLLPQSAGMIHLFLDRPSAPYAHLLNYLRSPPATATLPRTVSLGTRHIQSPDRLEALLELRDEAKYLGLDELHKLCCDEVRQRQGHIRGRGSGGSHDSNTSSASGLGQVLILGNERGRDAGLVRLGAIVQHNYKREDKVVERDSTGSIGHASATSEVAHVESVPISPTAPASVRAMSPSERAVPRSRSHSRGNPRSASDWI